jgi:hypothetical protein
LPIPATVVEKCRGLDRTGTEPPNGCLLAPGGRPDKGERVMRATRGVRRGAVMRGVTLGIVLSVAGAGLALASSHDIELGFSVSGTPVTSVVAGTTVDVTGTKSDDQDTFGNWLQIHQCKVEGIPSPWQACVGSEAEGVWGEPLAQAAAATNDSVTYAFDTTGLGGITAGFRAQWVPPGSHSGAIDYGNLTITLPSNGSSHPGCQGIENAYEKVTGNNGSTKGNGKGAQALAAVAEKLGCDISD